MKNLVIDPPSGVIPYLPNAGARRDATTWNHLAPDWHEIDPQTKCFPEGIPRIHYQGTQPFLIQQTGDYVVFLYEYQHMYRLVPLTNKPRLGKNIKLWMGDARGHWEGNTLVIESTNFNGKARFDIVGNYYGDTARVVERWTVASPNKIEYRATIDDSKTFDRPWTLALTFNRNEDPKFELMEQSCWEGERDAKHMVQPR